LKKTSLKGRSRPELESFIADIGEKPFRAKQIWSWMYRKGILSFDEMTNLSKGLRAKLKQTARIDSLHLVKATLSDESGTQKFLWRLADGNHVESVYIPERKRRTICISTQVGCGLGCAFCATGRMGFIRDLEPYEIIDQVLSVRRRIDENPTNIVVMGMGEPFLNYDNVIRALYIINDPEGIAVGHRKITISTAGIIPQIRHYAREGHPFKLAISLNATEDKTRSVLMPINKKYPIQELLKTAKAYTMATKKRLTFEYILIKDVNDSPDDARRLLRLLRNIPCKVNIIAYNTTSQTYTRPDNQHIEAFAESIRPLCAPVTLRLSRGSDIHAACGQLAVQLRDEHKKKR
jgi:23S rRNA (adenine2503-C2)-methyltransferase